MASKSRRRPTLSAVDIESFLSELDNPVPLPPSLSSTIISSTIGFGNPEYNASYEDIKENAPPQAINVHKTVTTLDLMKKRATITPILMAHKKPKEILEDDFDDDADVEMFFDDDFGPPPAEFEPIDMERELIRKYCSMVSRH
jgi:hypothetical protein